MRPPASQRSASRRDAIPARASTFWIRSPARCGPRSGAGVILRSPAPPPVPACRARSSLELVHARKIVQRVQPEANQELARRAVQERLSDDLLSAQDPDQA